ncbi:hypothetical protein F4778DRAFT_783820 [Xylariomycetidae sp. FL2044]|nr:hypothetical protein F4778DRAFT_783820 [Xylariomycetidae sp. FL2044]
MSEHSYGYGYNGQQPRMPYSGPASSPNFQPPYFGTPNQSAIPPTNYAMANNNHSFAYNANQIPGLGLGGMGGPAVPTPSYHAPKTNAWPQAPTSHTTASFQVHGPSIPPSSGLSSVSRYAQGPRASSSVPQQPPGPIGDVELSEGEFEDLYEPRDTSDVPPAQMHHSTDHAATAVENQHGSIGDADGSSIYDAPTPPQRNAAKNSSTSLAGADGGYTPDDEWEPTYVERDRTGSYSPYLSPSEVHRKPPTAKGTSREVKQKSRIQNTAKPSSAVNKTPSTNGAILPLSAGVLATNTEPKSPDPAYRSVAEAKRKAQEAILNLWPLKIRFRDYIEEGLDEKLIKGLFTDLGLDSSVPKNTGDSRKVPTEPVASASPMADEKVVSTGAAVTKPTSPQTPSIITKDAPSTEEGGKDKRAAKSAAEERKDIIARKLAAKAQKPPATSQATVPEAPGLPPQPSRVSQPPQPPSLTVVTGTKTMDSTPSKPKTRAENNAILHQKLAALKQSRDKLVAEKKAADAVEVASSLLSAPPATSTNPSVPETQNNAISPKKPDPVSTTTATASPRPILPNSRVSTGDGDMPGLSSSSSQLPQPFVRTLKRPVASDFDNHPNQSGTLKRTRTQDTLIIDVSDDDDDVEMEIGSQVDEEPTPTESATLPSRKAALASFPPLTDTPNWKQRSSPASSAVPTPPLHGAKLDLLHKRIEETKRRIAEAEAKKAALKVNDIQSPQVPSQFTQTQLSPSSERESARLPKVAEARMLAKRLGSERRDRIASYELPLVDATLREKQDKLKQVVAEAAQLELEIQERMDERRRLDAELNELSANAAAEALEESAETEVVNGQTSSSTIVDAINLAVDPQPISELEKAVDQPSTTEDTAISSIHSTQDDSTDVPDVVAATDRSSPDSDVQMEHDDGVIDDESSEHPAQIDEQLRQEADHASMVAETSIPDPPAERQTSQDAAERAGDKAEAPDTAEANMSMETSLADSSASDEDTYEPRLGEISNPHDTRVSETANAEAVDDVPDEPNPTHVAARESSKIAADEPIGEDEQESIITPEDLLSYQSPLGYFRAYRFHPKFTEQVSGGLKSMTYSSRIDPMRPICPDALAGEQCPRGNACEYQHFENMALSDGEIITQLGSSDMFTGETKNRFIDGLKKVLNGLKANKVKDFDRITKAIVQYRQDFMQDKSKVLPLETGFSYTTS